MANWTFYTTRNRGNEYVIASYSRWVPELKQPRIAERLHVGSLRDGYVVRLSKRALERFPEFAGKTVCYWKNALWERDALLASDEEFALAVRQQEVEAAEQAAAAVVAQEEDTDDTPEALNNILACGVSWAVWTKLKLSGIVDDLKAVFGEEDGLKLAGLVTYTFASESDSMHKFEDWHYNNYLPQVPSMNGQRISELLARVSPELSDEFFRRRHDRARSAALARRAAKAADGGYVPPMQLALDSTSLSAYSNSIRNAEYGNDKQDEDLKQINLCSVCDRETGEVLYGFEYQESLNDRAGLKHMLERMTESGFDLSETLWVTERDYRSIYNLQQQIACDLRFLQGQSLDENALITLFDKYRDQLRDLRNINTKHDVFVVTPGDYAERVPGTERVTERVFLHLYRNAQRELETYKSLLGDATEVCRLKNLGLRVDDGLWSRCGHLVAEDKKRQDARWQPMLDEIVKVAERAGCFAIRTNEVPCGAEALTLYRARNEVERHFRRMKALNGSNRLETAERAFRGKLFLFLLAESVRNLLGFDLRRNAEKLNRKIPGNSLEKVLANIAGIYAVRRAQNARWRVAAVTKRQREAYELLGLPALSGTFLS